MLRRSVTRQPESPSLLGRRGAGLGKLLLQRLESAGTVLEQFEYQSKQEAGIIGQFNDASRHLAAGMLRGKDDLMVKAVHVDADSGEYPVSSQATCGGARRE